MGSLLGSLAVCYTKLCLILLTIEGSLESNLRDKAPRPKFPSVPLIYIGEYILQA